MPIVLWTLASIFSILFTGFCISGIMALPGTVILYAFGVSIGLIATGVSLITLIFGLSY